MADPVKRATLLPSIATPRERALGGANAAAGEIDHDVIRRAGSPDIAEVPPEYLPARAEARSVDVWDPLWPDDIKRAAIIAAPIVHRHKGTVLAVKTALSALKIDAVVTEWWQEAPRGVPYTFTVKAYARARLYDGPLLDARLTRVVYASVLRAKPESRAFDLVLGAKFPQSLGLASVALGKVAVRKAARPSLSIEAGCTLGLAPVALGKVAVRKAARPSLSIRSTQTIGLARAALGRVVVRRSVLLRSP